MMFYLTSKFHDNRVNTFGFMEGGGLLKAPSPPGPGTPKKPRRNRVNKRRYGMFFTVKFVVKLRSPHNSVCSDDELSLETLALIYIKPYGEKHTISTLVIKPTFRVLANAETKKLLQLHVVTPAQTKGLSSI